MSSEAELKRPADEQLVPSVDAKRVRVEPLVESSTRPIGQAPTELPKPEYGQFSSVGNIIETELNFLNSKLPMADADSLKIYNDRISELTQNKAALMELSSKLANVSGDAAMDQATELLYSVDKNSQFAKLASDAAERLSVLQGIYAPRSGSASNPLSIMSTALFSMPDLNGDGIIDEKDLKTGTDAGDFDRNLAIRDEDGSLLLYAGEYDLEKLDRLGQYKFTDFKDFALRLAREGLDVGNRLPAGTNFSFRREGLPNFSDFEKWPEDFKQKYYDYVSEKAVSGTGYEKLQGFADLVQKKPYNEWTDKERSEFIKFQDAYVIADNDYGTYLVTRDNPQWNANDAKAYNKQLAAGGNRYYVDHTAEYLMKVIKPIAIVGNVVAGVATLGAAAAGLVASTVGTALGSLGAASSLSVGSGLAGGALALGGFTSSAVGGAAAAASTGITGALTGFARNVVATGGENLVQIGQTALTTLAPKAGELATQTAFREIAKSAGADGPTLAMLDAVGELSGLMVSTGIQSGYKSLAFETFESAIKQNLTGPKLVEFVVHGTEKIVKEYAPKNIRDLPSLTKLVAASMSDQDIVSVLSDTIHEFAQSSLVSGDSSKFVGELDRFVTGIKAVEGLIGSGKAASMESTAMAIAQDYLLNQLPKLRGQQFTSPVEEELFKRVSKEAYSSNPPSEIGPYKLSYSSDTMKVYIDPGTKRLVIGVRGSADNRDRFAWAPTAVGALKSTDRYAYDKMQLDSIIRRFPPEQYNYFISGHSLGGALSTEFKRQYPFIQKAVVYNSATAPQDIVARDAADVKRIFYKSDILYNLQGGKLTASEVRGSSKGRSDDKLLDVIGMVQGHKMDNFFVDERRSTGYNY